MKPERIVELLEIEHECVLRNTHDDCDRNCADCDLVQDDYDLHEMYVDAIQLAKKNVPMLADEECPACGGFIGTWAGGIAYCVYCGQKLAWRKMPMQAVEMI